MATKLYIGINGSGKSYEVVTVVILGALRDGRRVVSNLAGLNFPSMQTLLINEGLPIEKIGSIVQVSHEDVLKANFFRTDTDPPEFQTFIQPGDVLVLDEIWRFWETSRSVTSRQLNYFRMHRHFVHPETGKTCENVLITQLVSDLPLKIKGVVEKTYSMTKHTDLGTDEYYRVDVYSKAKFTDRTPPLNSFQRKYNPEYFCLYKSHSVNEGGIQAQEKSIDKRGNIWQKPIIKFGFPLAIVTFSACFYMLWKFFHPANSNNAATIKSASAENSVPASNATALQKPQPSIPEIVHTWRVQGWFYSGDSLVVTLSGGSGRLRFLHNPPNFKMLGRELEILLPEGGFATSYGGNSDTQFGLIK